VCSETLWALLTRVFSVRYKVAHVVQKETSGDAERRKQIAGGARSKSEEVIQREVRRILTIGMALSYSLSSMLTVRPNRRSNG
jgi:hypothetical protein